MNVVSVIRWSIIPTLCITLLGCDVVKLDANGRPIIPMSAEEAASLTNLEPQQIADKLWDAILQEAESTDAVSAPQQETAFIRISGTVISVDDSKKAATMTVQTKSYGDVTVQIGPIVRGNAIRDAASFIHFDDFKNQVQFARLSKELNKKALQGITRPDSSWQGSQVDILAAATVKETMVSGVIPLDMVKR